MGLNIISKSEYKYTYSYSAIHRIRWAALVDCGLPKELDGEPTYLLLDNNHSYSKFKSADIELIRWILMVAGYSYPNLLLHSDCEGSYTLRGKVFKANQCFSGNSKGLLKELVDLKDTINEIQDQRLTSIYTDLFNLVKDVVCNHDGKLTFR